jgi:hypothetical protein
VTTLSFEVVGARPEPYAAVPTIMFRLRVAEADGRRVHAVALRCQIRIEPQKRRYQPDEEEHLYELFGETPRWGETLRPFLWTHVSHTLAGFDGSTEVDLAVECSYDLEVAGAKYFHALEGGEVPLVFLFSGTAFTPGTSGFAAERVGWNQDADYRMPVSVWRDLMDMYFPGSGWLRLSRVNLDRLQKFKAVRALPTWDQAVEQLLKLAGEDDE